MTIKTAIALFLSATAGVFAPVSHAEVAALPRADVYQAAADESRARFREIFCAVEADHGAHFPCDEPCSQALHKLAGEPPPTGRPVYLGKARVRLRIVIVPGILGECVEKMATPYEDAVEPLVELGWRIQTLRVGGRSGSAANARQIRDELRALHLAPDEKLVLIGYSKGMSDILELLGSADAGVIPPDSSIVSVTGVVRGTPIADRASRAYRHFRWLPLPGCGPGDGLGVESLTRAYRLHWLAAHKLRMDLHYFSLPAFTNRPNVSWILRQSWDSLAREDPHNDGNVIATDAIIPGSQVLGYANSDHWALVLPFALEAPRRARLFATRNAYPRVVLLESIARYIEEQYLGRSSM